jgi:hypothetical protein
VDSKGEGRFAGVTTGPVQVGRYILDLDAPGGTVLSLAPRGRWADPPADLAGELNRGPQEPQDLASRLDEIADKATDVTDAVERALELIRGLAEGRALEAKVLGGELEALSSLLKRLEQAGRFGEAIRLARPFCRLCALALRWALLVESLRIVLHAATALADPRTAAWAQHELGTLHQSVGDVDAARRALREARAARKEIGDEAGLAATDHNLALLPRRPLPQLHTAALIGAGVVLMLGLLLGLVSGIDNGSTSAPSSSSSITSAAQPQVPGAGIAPPTVDFGRVTWGTRSPARTVTLTSSGTASLIVTAVELAGANPGDFAVSDGCGGKSLRPEASCDIGVYFIPTATGPRQATLNLADNANGKPKQVTLVGTGIGTATAAVTPSKIDFSAVRAGESTSPAPVTLANDGTAPLIVSSVKLLGANPGDFAVSDGCGSKSLEPKVSCSVEVTFTPTAAGPRSANLTIADNAADSPQQIALLGTGATPIAQVSQPSVDLGSVVLGTQSAAQTVMLSNVGGAELTVGSLTLEGANPGDFTITSDGCSGRLLGAGVSCAVGVAFAPTANGPRTATLNFPDDAADGPQAVALSGDGTSLG